MLVDDEENILRSLTRLFRSAGCRILTANSGQEGLDLLQKHDVGVIISDQRMPVMSGVEFLSIVKDVHPETIRIVLSGYTELDSVTDAINRGAIYKFLTKPWDDNLLRENLEEAFLRYEMARENGILTRDLALSNERLANANRELDAYATLNYHALQISQEVLEVLPVGVVGFGDDDVVSFANGKAHAILASEGGALIGRDRKHVLPDELHDLPQDFDVEMYPERIVVETEEAGKIECMWSQLKPSSNANGFVLVLLPERKR